MALHILPFQLGASLNPKALRDAAGIVRHFVEDYHEKLEEDFVFTRLEKAGKLIDLVKVLRVQHKAGRVLTDAILSFSTLSAFKYLAQRKKLSETLASFIRMYRPHEGSVLFPAFRELLPASEFNDLGDMFEKKEHQLLGPDGFEGQVQIVERIEKQLWLYELSQYTPT